MKKRKIAWESFLEKMEYHPILLGTPKDTTSSPYENREITNSSKGKRKRIKSEGKEETPTRSQQSPKQAPTSSKKKGKKLVFLVEKENVQANEDPDSILHREESPKTNKEQLNDKGKSPMNVPERDHDKLLIESLHKKSEEYNMLNDSFMEELRGLRKEKDTNIENRKGKDKRIKEDRVGERKNEAEKFKESHEVKELRNEIKLV